ncbi:hypothetical protein PAXRUDRAFT_825416 [Paxillus rubicundulus Ve08.2h10]|uniref:Uncharacterized protein n=1 Tax=Paxillus rubicundulus Ve08.2h10 TaxID=930991 RepID=A0A0D0DGF1_9AGAM|nr:hypothetical protein PAXRUDRAFT_825416 [Paxillus rubicundulus Ve08.2h10]
METWIKTLCWPMGYDKYQPQRIDELKDRIQHAVRLLQNSSDDFVVGPASRSRAKVRRSVDSLRDSFVGHGRSHAHSPHVHTPTYRQPPVNFPVPDLSPSVPHPMSHFQNPFQSPSGSLPMSELWISPPPLQFRQHPLTRAF